MIILNYDKNGLPIFMDSFHTHMKMEKAIEYIDLLNKYIKTADFEQLEYNENLYFYNEIYKPNMARTLSLHGKKKINGYVYFVKRSDGAIKVGCTANFDERMKVLKREFGALEIIHIIESQNMYVTEFAFHELFDKKRIKGEWFDLSEQFVRYIRLGRYYDFIQTTIDGNDFNYDVYFEEYYSRRAS